MSHKDVSSLLPWYLNGTLTEDDRRAVEAELARCEQCAAEVEELKALRAAVIDQNEAAPEPSPFLFSRAMSRVEEFERERTIERQFLRGWWKRQVPVVASILLAVPLVFVAAFAAVLTARMFAGPAQLAGPPMNEPTTVALEKATLNRDQVTSLVPVAPAAGAARQADMTLGPLTKTRQAQIQKHGEASLLVPAVEAAIHQLYGIAGRAGGTVSSLDDRTPNDPAVRHTASIQLLVPASRFDATMDAVGGVGRVVTRSVQAQDVTDQVVDLEARLRNLRHTESDLIRIMDRSGSVDQILGVENQLSEVRGQIEQLAGQLKSVQDQVAYSSIDIQLSAEAAATPVTPPLSARTADSWKAAVAAAQAVSLRLLDGVLWTAAFGPYLIALALVVGLGWYAYRRRRAAA